MRIRTFTRLVGLTAIGAVAYVHRQRGGEWTVASFKDTLQHMWSTMGTMFARAEDRTRDTLQRAAGVGQSTSRSGNFSDDNSRTYTDYKARKDDAGRH
jgi:hypothetical protein